MNARKRNLIIGTAVVAVCALVASVSLGGSTVKSVKIADLPEVTERCDVYGKLDYKSIKSLKGGHLVSFQIRDEKTDQPLNVLYENQAVALPANFPNASHAKVTGRYEPVEAKFVADQVLTKCPSKYDQELKFDPKQKEAVERWQRETAARAEAGA